MKQITYISDNGFIIVFNEVAPFILNDIVDSVSGIAVTSRAPLQDGQTIQSLNLDVMQIDITGYVIAIGTHNREMREVLNEYKTNLRYAFNPKTEGLLIFEDKGINRQVRCRAITSPIFGAEQNNMITINIELVADVPFWESSNLYIHGLGYTYKRLMFPLVLPQATGFIYNKVTINNPTAYEIAPIIEIFSSNSLISLLNKTSNKKIEINTEIQANEKIVIDISKKRADIYELDEGEYVYNRNATNYLTLDSEWWKLERGNNLITINEQSTTTSVAYIKYRLPY